MLVALAGEVEVKVVECYSCRCTLNQMFPNKVDRSYVSLEYEELPENGGVGLFLRGLDYRPGALR